MKKKLFAVLIIMILLFSATAPAAAGGFRDRLKDLEEKVVSTFSSEKDDSEKYMAEKTVKKLLGYVEEECRKNGIEPEEALNQVLGLITDEEGNLDLSTVFSLIGLFTPEETDLGAEPAVDKEIPAGGYIEQIRNREVVLRAYLLDEYKDVLEPGDVQIVSYADVSNDDGDSQHLFGYFSLYNYTVDGGDLKLKNNAGGMEYLVFDMDEDLKFTLTEVHKPEEGEGYNASIDALCEENRVTREEFDDKTRELYRDWDVASGLMYYLENHPEYERAEYKGELKTRDELEEVVNGFLEIVLEEAFAGLDDWE